VGGLVFTAGFKFLLSGCCVISVVSGWFLFLFYFNGEFDPGSG
jgi:hypothetical protein